MEQNQKNEVESKLVLELYEDCEKGSYSRIKKNLEDNAFSSKVMDVAIRRCLKNRKRERHEYHDSLNLLLQYVNVNFRNEKEDNSTIIMAACKIGDVSLVDLLLGFDFTTNHCHPSIKLDLQVKDDNGRNFLHYLVNKENQEEEACEVFDRFVYSANINFDVKSDIPECIDSEEVSSNSGDNSKRTSHGGLNFNMSNVNINITQELNVEDKDGYTPLGLSLMIGWALLSKKFLSAKSKTNSIIRNNWNNLVHLSVLGKNLNCIKQILTQSGQEEVKHKNKEGLTPRELAKNLKLNYYARIIENFEENCLNPSFLSIFSTKHLQVSDILEKFYTEDFEETLFLINQLKINQSILSSNNKNLNIEWNVFLTKYYIKLNANSKQENKSKGNCNKPNKYELTPESILSKFIQGKDNFLPKNLNTLSEFKEFFDNIKSDTLSYDDEETKALDILIYNKGLFYFKIGDFITTLRIFSEYLKHGLSVNDTMYYKWFIYVNISFILIEGLTSLKYTKLVTCIVEKIEEFLFTHIRTKKDETFTADLIQVNEYLNQKEVINQFSPTWDESFCLVNLLKAMRHIYEMRTDEAKLSMKEFKRLFKTCNYKEVVRVMDTMYNFYTCLKIKMLYIENSFSKCFKKMNKVFKITQKANINLSINNHRVVEGNNGNEYLLFYLNTMGILNLKLKKYLAAEVFFKTGITHYKKVYFQLEEGTFDFSIRLNYVYSIKYNLGLCYFFQKKYDKAFIIFREVSKNRNMNCNVFLWYRLGLCCLEIELLDIRKFKSGRNDIVSKAFGYEVYKNESNLNNNNNNNDEDLMDTAALNLNFIDEDDSSCLTPSCSKRIVLQNNFNGSYGSRRKVFDAVAYFKQVLLLSSSNVNCNSKLNEKNELFEIYNFYFDKRTAYMDNNFNDEPFEKISPKIKSIYSLVTSTYLNLVFCLSLTENWTEILFYCDQFERSPFYKKEKDIMYKFHNFKIEALINLRQFQTACDIIKNDLLLLSNNDFRGSFFNKVNSTVYSDTSFKLALNVNLIKIHFISNNLSEAEKSINNVISMIGNNAVQELPSFIHNLLIYSNLLKGNQQVALNLIKFRKNSLISQMANSANVKTK